MKDFKDFKDFKELKEDEVAALQLTEELLKPGMDVSEATYGSALAALGERRTFEAGTERH